MTALNHLPVYYDDLELSFEEAWGVVKAGVTNRHSPAHMPAVGTIDETGAPQMRIMVLRDVSRESATLRFHTDARSSKAVQLQQKNATSVLIYDHPAKIQIRLSGTSRLVFEGDIADAAWNSSTPFARRCYMAASAPGTPSPQPSSGLPDWIQGKQPDEGQLTDYRPNFAAMIVDISTIEWLYLANVGHRRARWQFDSAQNSWSGSWLIP